MRQRLAAPEVCLDQVILQPEHVTAHGEGDALVLAHPALTTHLRLNGTGRRIWELLDGPTALGTLCDRLRDEFDVAPAECEAYVQQLVHALVERGLIEVVPEAPGHPGMRRRYLDLLKHALVNLLYAEHELRMDYLRRGPGTAGRPDERLLRDIRYRDPERYAALVALKRGADWPSGMAGLARAVEAGPAASTAHTLIGLRRLHNIEYCARHVFAHGIAGDFLEAGVCQGGATIFMRALQVAFDEGHRRVWVADSFQGVPPPTAEIDRRSGLDLSEGRVPWMAISLEAVQDNFRTYGLLDDQVRFLPGWFADTLPGAPVERLAILRIDGDLYQSTREVLEALYDAVAPGGFVIVDDYYVFEPCRLAVDTFREERGITDRLRRIDWCAAYWQKAS